VRQLIAEEIAISSLGALYSGTQVH